MTQSFSDQIIQPFRPVLEDPNFYAQKIITHLNHLFIPRKGEGRNSKMCPKQNKWNVNAYF